jgi:hypothetical protein
MAWVEKLVKRCFTDGLTEHRANGIVFESILQ